MTAQTESDRQNATRLAQFGALDRAAQSFGRSLASAFNGGVTSGKSLDSILGTVGAKLATLAAKLAAGPLRAGMSSLFNSLFSPDSGGDAEFARGGVFAGGRVMPFASGGVVAAPTYFPMASGTGLMGEAGPEAIMPLSRGPDGRLGVAASQGARPVAVNVTIATPDPAAFRRSEAQVAAALARAVARGQRAL